MINTFAHGSTPADEGHEKIDSQEDFYTAKSGVPYPIIDEHGRRLHVFRDEPSGSSIVYLDEEEQKKIAFLDDIRKDTMNLARINNPLKNFAFFMEMIREGLRDSNQSNDINHLMNQISSIDMTKIKSLKDITLEFIKNHRNIFEIHFPEIFKKEFKIIDAIRWNKPIKKDQDSLKEFLGNLLEKAHYFSEANLDSWGTYLSSITSDLLKSSKKDSSHICSIAFSYRSLYLCMKKCQKEYKSFLDQVQTTETGSSSSSSSHGVFEEVIRIEVDLGETLKSQILSKQEERLKLLEQLLMLKKSRHIISEIDFESKKTELDEEIDKSSNEFNNIIMEIEGYNQFNPSKKIDIQELLKKGVEDFKSEKFISIVWRRGF
jgi:hypothetical protein